MKPIEEMTYEELMARSREIDHESADVLFAISVLTRRMAIKLSEKSKAMPEYAGEQGCEDGPDTQNKCPCPFRD